MWIFDQCNDLVQLYKCPHSTTNHQQHHYLDYRKRSPDQNTLPPVPNNLPQNHYERYQHDHDQAWIVRRSHSREERMVFPMRALSGSRLASNRVTGHARETMKRERGGEGPVPGGADLTSEQ